MVDKKGLLYPQNKKKLTKAEQELLDMITTKFYSLKQIIIVKNCSRQAVYKLLKKLKEKGVLNTGLQKVDKFQPTSQPNQVRLHGQEFNIKILWQDSNYQKLLNKSNIMFIDGHTIRLYKNSIEIYAGEGISFSGEDEERADKKSLEYWKRFFIKLEHRLRVIIVKESSFNIKEVNHHYARGNSEICDKAIEERKKIRIYATEDKKLAFITDDSFGNREDETVHPITAKPDRKVIDKQINDWRINNPPTISEIAYNLNKSIDAINKVTQNQVMFAKNIEEHMKVLKDIRKAIKLLTKK